MAAAEQEVFSSEKSYHAMLMHAQSLSPALAYVLCALFMKESKQCSRSLCKHGKYGLPEWKTSMIPYCDSAEVACEQDDGMDTYFSGVHPQMSKFLQAVFGDFVVRIIYEDAKYRFRADEQFVKYLRSGVLVDIDHDRRLVTIKP